MDLECESEAEKRSNLYVNNYNYSFLSLDNTI